MTLKIIISNSQKQKTSTFGSLCGYYFDTKQRENNYGEVKRRSFLELKQPKKEGESERKKSEGMDLFQEEKNLMDVLFENMVPIFYSKVQHYSLFCLNDNGDSIICKV